MLLAPRAVFCQPSPSQRTFGVVSSLIRPSVRQHVQHSLSGRIAGVVSAAAATGTIRMSVVALSTPIVTIQAAVDEVWPAESASAEAAIKRAAALHLLDSTNQSSSLSLTGTYAASTVVRSDSFGTMKQLRALLGGKRISAVLREEPLFQLSSGGDGGKLALDVSTLLLRAGNRQQQNSSSITSSTNSDSSSVDDGVPTAAQLLAFVRDRRWHNSTAIDKARRAVAMHLVQQANDDTLQEPHSKASTQPDLYAIRGGAAGSLMKAAVLGSVDAAWPPGEPRPYTSTEKALAGDAYLLVTPTKHEVCVSLDIWRLLADAAAATSTTSVGVTALSPVQLLEFVESRHWHPSNDALHDARRALAAHIVQQAHQQTGWQKLVSQEHYAVERGIAGKVMISAVLGSPLATAWPPGYAKPYKTMAKALADDPFFTLDDGQVSLDIKLLLKEAKAAMVTAAQQAAHVAQGSVTAGQPSSGQRLLFGSLQPSEQEVSSEASSGAESSSEDSDTASRFFSRRGLGSRVGHHWAVQMQQLPSGLYAASFSADPVDAPSSSSARSGVAPEGSADPEPDESLESMMAVLPDSLRLQLQPFCRPEPGREVLDIMADAGHPVQLRLADQSIVQLPISISIADALRALEAAAATGSNLRPDPALSGASDSSDSCSSDDPESSDGAAAPTAAADYAEGRGLFGSDNRMGLPGTLHRISAIRDKRGRQAIGLTYRVGRHLPGAALLLADVLSSMKASIRGPAAQRPQSLLLLGRPGVGKTTLLRDIARLLSLPPAEGGLGLSVVIVDTSNEIAGDAWQRHTAVGNARRMMVPQREQQAAVLVEAVQNHAPDCIIVDEIGTAKEVAAARTIAQRGVLLIGTAHGATLGNLLRNPELRPLVGGVQPVTLGDKEARASNQGAKIRLERAGAATFTMLLELQQRHRWRLHMDVEQSVDLLLSSSAALAPAAGPFASMDGSAGEGATNTQLRSSSRVAGADDEQQPAQQTICFNTREAMLHAAAAAAAVDQLAAAIDAGDAS